ncbi:hypothetical protein NDU88_008120 [Pleurodeles waltl]|uniref:Uncharacterized protein n=1 Tax=Pleurodeles waltl TaxID=8319 RepID=A0AAV7QML2_PLEWA|nr:hypothetical protein NDU88_008120 [Pleurodeles waltl]
MVYNTAFIHLDQNTYKHQDWFNDSDEDIQKLLDEKREAFRSLQQGTTSVSKKAAYNSLKRKYADSNNSKHFYDALKTIYRRQSSGTSLLLNADYSTMLTEKSAILKRWVEHFNNFLNRPFSIIAEVIDCMPQVAINTSLAEPLK